MNKTVHCPNQRDNAMAFADPQSVLISGVTHSLPRTGSGPSNGTFKSNDGNVQLTVSSQYGKRFRRNVRLDFSKIAADPLVSSTSVKYSMSAYVVIDTPVTGFTVAEAKAVVDGLIGHLSATTGAAITKVLGGEN